MRWWWGGVWGGRAVLGGAEWVWVVDPIDGTTNFVHGLPLSVVSVGVARRGQLARARAAAAAGPGQEGRG